MTYIYSKYSSSTKGRILWTIQLARLPNKINTLSIYPCNKDKSKAETHKLHMSLKNIKDNLATIIKEVTDFNKDDIRPAFDGRPVPIAGMDNSYWKYLLYVLMRLIGSRKYDYVFKYRSWGIY